MHYFFRICCITILMTFVLTIEPMVVRAAAEPAFSLRPVYATANRSESQNYFVYDLAPDQQVQDSVLVRNTGAAAGTVHLYGVDSTTGDNSGAAFPNEDSPRYGVGTWIQFSLRDFQLGPGEERIVPFSVTIPAEATGGQHLGGIVAANAVISQGTPTGGMQINTQTRTITAVQVNLPGPVIEKVAVTSVVTGGRSAQQTIILGLSNEGTQMVKPLGTLIVTDAQGQEVQRLPLKLDTFLPSTTINYPIAVQKQALGMGQYQAKVDLTYGTSGVTSYEGDFSVTAAQVAQIFPSSQPRLAPPAAIADKSTSPSTNSATQSQWPLFAGGAVIVVLALAGGVFLGRRGRAADVAK